MGREEETDSFMSRSEWRSIANRVSGVYKLENTFSILTSLSVNRVGWEEGSDDDDCLRSDSFFEGNKKKNREMERDTDISFC